MAKEGIVQNISSLFLSCNRPLSNFFLVPIQKLVLLCSCQQASLPKSAIREECKGTKETNIEELRDKPQVADMNDSRRSHVPLYSEMFYLHLQHVLSNLEIGTPRLRSFQQAQPHPPSDAVNHPRDETQERPTPGQSSD